MLKLGRVTKFKMLFLVLVFVFNFDLFKFSAAILKEGLFKVILENLTIQRKHSLVALDNINVIFVCPVMTILKSHSVVHIAFRPSFLSKG